MDFPDWANDKQKEGMELASAIAREYGAMDISFEPDIFVEEGDSIFWMMLDWESHMGEDLGKRHHEMRIGYDYEPTWDCFGERIHQWQFIFGGEATRELTTEIFFLDLFFYFDTVAKT